MKQDNTTEQKLSKNNVLLNLKKGRKYRKFLLKQKRNL